MVEEEDGLTLYTSFYPMYALTLEVTKGVENLTVKCLTQPQDGCIRSYELSQWDAGILSQADALILGGAGLESFAQQMTGGDIPLIQAMEGLSLERSEARNDSDSHWQGENPWLFLDPAGAKEICTSIAQSMISVDPGYADTYMTALEHAEKRLDQLAEGMVFPQGGQVAVMHEGLSYLARAMNLTVYARIEREPGSSLEGNDLADAVKMLKESGAQAVLIERQAPQPLVEALENAGFSVALIDTLTTHAESEGSVYFEAMRENARAVFKALEKQ